MELKEIKEITNSIASDIRQANNSLVYYKYTTFLSWFGMANRKNSKIIKRIDYQLRNNGISLWRGNEERFSVGDFSRAEFITFRFQKNEGIKIDSNPTLIKMKVSNKNAGMIEISDKKSGINLYKHQEDAIQSLNEKIPKQSKSGFAGILVLPTGGGKTLTAAYWLAKNYLDKNKKVLWIAHRHELLNQAKATFHERLAFSDIFSHIKSFNYRIISGNHDQPVNILPTDNLIISSKDSLNANFEHLCRNWLKNDADEIFLVIDEAHHATAKTYRNLIANLRTTVGTVKILGLTATPFRTAEREQGLLQKVFPDDIIYKIDLRSLINRGVLSEPKFETAHTGFTAELNERQVERIKNFDIDSLGAETIKTIAENVGRNRAIVDRYVKNKQRYRQTLVFALNQDNAVALNKLFGEKGIKSDFVISGTQDMITGVSLSNKQNAEKIDRFRNDELVVLINVNILTEGTDLPNTQTVFLARPTISSILMTQMIGRGLRGKNAGGTEEAFIVSFIDNWQDKIAWVNPELLNIEENIDFSDKERDTKTQLLRLIAISKIEEFASLIDKTIDNATRRQIENLDFIERIPLGIYHFSILIEPPHAEPREKTCEILIYDNIRQSYEDFINSLPQFFADNKLKKKDYLSEDELEDLLVKVENEFFYGCEKYPGYLTQDIKDVLQLYAQNEAEPKFIELAEREKYDLTTIAMEIKERDFRISEKTDFINQLWDSNKSHWNAFFGFDNKRYFENEIDMAVRRILDPENNNRPSIIPHDKKESREIEKLSMWELREYDYELWKQLSDRVFEKAKDRNGFYECALSSYKSNRKLDFQIDHINPISQGGLTVLNNLQLLTKRENRTKGSKQ